MTIDMRSVPARNQFVSGDSGTDYLDSQGGYGFFGRPTGAGMLNICSLLVTYRILICTYRPAMETGVAALWLALF